jgi:hypothetical protein
MHVIGAFNLQAYTDYRTRIIVFASRALQSLPHVHTSISETHISRESKFSRDLLEAFLSFRKLREAVRVGNYDSMHALYITSQTRENVILPACGRSLIS